MPRTAPYGSWRSPISVEMAVAGIAGISALQRDGDDLYWIQTRPSEEGREVLVRGGARPRLPGAGHAAHLAIGKRGDEVVQRVLGHLRVGVGENEDVSLRDRGRLVYGRILPHPRKREQTDARRVGTHDFVRSVVRAVGGDDDLEPLRRIAHR